MNNTNVTSLESARKGLSKKDIAALDVIDFDMFRKRLKLRKTSEFRYDMMFMKDHIRQVLLSDIERITTKREHPRVGFRWTVYHGYQECTDYDSDNVYYPHELLGVVREIRKRKMSPAFPYGFELLLVATLELAEEMKDEFEFKMAFVYRDNEDDSCGYISKNNGLVGVDDRQKIGHVRYDVTLNTAFKNRNSGLVSSICLASR